MLTAAEVLQRHPQGCWVFDARGRRIDRVFACDPYTGEVISHYMPWIARAWFRILWTRADLPRSLRPFALPGWACLLTRHGFWPAPLHLVPKPAPPAAWPAGPICDSQRYIVGNGDREEPLP